VRHSIRLIFAALIISGVTYAAAGAPVPSPTTSTTTSAEAETALPPVSLALLKP
jgi:hypothetical protein